MQKVGRLADRRNFLKSAVMGETACAFGVIAIAQNQSDATIPLFDGKTLDGWIDAENSATVFGSGDIPDLAAFAKKLADKSKPVAAFVSDQLDDAVKTALSALRATDAVTTASAPGATTGDKATKFALVRNLNKIISGVSIYDESRF
jgi:hypothetical protein